MIVTITVASGIHKGRSYTGPLAEAPVEALVPEGVISDRTRVEAERVRSAIRHALRMQGEVTIDTLRWAVHAKREPDVS